MKKKYAVCTLTVGDFYEQLAKDSHPMIQSYAEKCDADFVIRYHAKHCSKIIGYEKLFLINELLEDYERVLFVDTDILIRFDAPNLFDLVPKNCIGAFNEGDMYPQRRKAKENFLRQLRLNPDSGLGKKLDVKNWVKSSEYFNTGVMLVSKEHIKIFKGMPDVVPDNFGEQTFLNFRMRSENKFHLPYRFNKLIDSVLFTGEPLQDAYFLHFAGAFSDGSPVEQNIQAWTSMANQFRKFNETGFVPHIPKLLYIETAGALGDVVATEPVVRYIRKELEPSADITIKTLFPEVFAHIKDFPQTTILGPSDTAPDRGHLRLHLFPEPPIANYNLMPPVDYAALAAFRGHVPNKHKHIQLRCDTPPPVDVRDMVLVHPGKSWQSKTFPKTWWDGVIKGVQKFTGVCIIGKTYPDDDFRGTVDVDVSGCLDLRNQTSLTELFAIIKEAKLLVSNDSSPVHISGAFNTPTIMVTSAKHQDFIWPYRDPRLNITLGKPISAGTAKIGVINNIFMHQCSENELLDALPHPSEVVGKIKEVLIDRARRQPHDGIVKPSICG